MYAIIRWGNKNEVFPMIHTNQTLIRFDTIEDANRFITVAKEDKILFEGDDIRIISIDGVTV